jgi:homoserine kinase
MHPLVLALFDDPASAATAARGLRSLGLARERVSVVTRSHDEEGALAEAAGASPGSEIEDSRRASQLGELSAHLLAAIALVLPGVGPIVADGPLAAGLGEAAGHVAGGIARALHHAGLERQEAERWQEQIEQGAILIGAHVDAATVPAARDIFQRNRAVSVTEATWSD